MMSGFEHKSYKIIMIDLAIIIKVLKLIVK
jgi:hypothetical protein